MKVFVFYFYLVEESFGGVLYCQIIESFKVVGYEVDDCDFYVEGFDLVLLCYDCLIYYIYLDNMVLVFDYVECLKKVEVLVICMLVWNFGFFVMLKGYFDCVWLLGVIFQLVDGKV